MSGWPLVLTIIGMTLVTIGTRSFFLVFGERMVLPSRVQRGLRYAPACALAALVVPLLVLDGDALNLSWSNPRLDAGVVALVVMRASGSMLAAMIAGMAAFLLLRNLL